MWAYVDVFRSLSTNKLYVVDYLRDYFSENIFEINEKGSLAWEDKKLIQFPVM